MPANIAFTMGRYNAMYADKPAWHNLGTVVAGAQTPEEALRLAGTDYTVAKTPIYFRPPEPPVLDALGGSTSGGYGFTEIPSHVATYRTDTNQLLGIMRWVMEGNRGLVYLRIMRAASKIIHPAGFAFEYGKAYPIRTGPADRAVIVSSGRGVHEALKAADLLGADGIAVGVVDMPSVDAEALRELAGSGKLVVIAEQNNGWLWSQLRKALFAAAKRIDPSSLVPINTLGPDGEPRFIHSATYDALLAESGLAPGQIADTIKSRLRGRG